MLQEDRPFHANVRGPTRAETPAPATRYLYAIPHENAFVVYAPLKRLGFIANAAMLDLLERMERGAVPARERSSDAARFLENIGVLAPDPTAPDSNHAAQRNVVVLCLTTRCNLRCTYCYAAAGETAARALPFEVGRRAIDEVCRGAVEAKQPSFTLAFHGGGEPTLARATLRQLVEYARGLAIPCHVTMTTNGCWPDADREWLLDHLDSVSLSCDGIAEIQNAQRPAAGGGESFDAVLKTIRSLDARRIAYGIRLTVTDGSVDSLVRSVDFLCRETACGVFQVEPAFAQGRAERSGTALADGMRFASAVVEAYDVAVAAKRDLYYSGARPWVVTSRFCGALDRALVVTPDGDLTACYEVCGREHPLASAFVIGEAAAGGASIDEERRVRLDRRIGRRRSLCEGCFCYWHCAGDCPAKTLGTDGEDDRFAMRCDVNRFVTRELLLRRIAASGGVWCGGEPAPVGTEVCE